MVGGGAAGFFAAIKAAEENPSAHVTLLERMGDVLGKVKISGGGRCNVTNACFEPAELVTHYPRGNRALRGPFSRFQPRDTLEWFEARGVTLKTEEDRRIFPTSDESKTVIQCLKDAAARAGVVVRTSILILDILKGGKSKGFDIKLPAETIHADRLILAPGSSPQGWTWARSLGHTIVPPVPSLFTFTISDPRLEGLEGLSVPTAVASLEGFSMKQTGPVLITHWGLSGPAILKLSAWAARELYEHHYKAKLRINWMNEREASLTERLMARRDGHPRNLIAADNFKEMPRRLWARLVDAAGVPFACRWAQVSNAHLKALTLMITDGVYDITGRGVFKEEFVTAGGVDLDDVDFRTMESKRSPGLYFAGEILDIDAETGGFNLQNAWTTGWIAGQAAAASPLFRQSGNSL